MPHPWEAEIEVTPDLAVRLVNEQFVAITIAWHGSEIGDAGLVEEGLTGMRLVLTD